MEANHVIDWLLEEENPSVRYFTLTRLLGKPANDSVVVSAQKAIMMSPLVIKIFAQQNANGSWGVPERFYTNKYEGTVWTLLILAELGAYPSDPRVKAACDFILKHSQEPLSFAFSVGQSVKSETGLPSSVCPCLTSNMVYALIKLGYLHDERVQKAIQWIVKYQRADDGVKLTPEEPKYAKLFSCFGNHSCHMGVAKALKALVAIPEKERTSEISNKIKQLSDYFLIHHIYKKSHNLEKEAKPGWKLFGFPLMYNTDVLEMLGLFSELRIIDPRLQESIVLVTSKRGSDGKWRLENTFNGKTLVEIEKKDEPSKWITLKALLALKAY